MPVNLKRIQPPVTLPASPKGWLWGLLLVAALFAGAGWAIYSNQNKAEINSAAFWRTALAVPGLVWLIALVLRLAWFQGQRATASGYNHHRQQTIDRETRRGRRSLPVLGISLHSALRAADDRNAEGQWAALQARVQALKTQASWRDNRGIRHSRLPRSGDELPEQLLARGLNTMLAALSGVLATLPAETPLALLLESNSSLPAEQLQATWLSCWQASQIRQPLVSIEGSGLAVVDRWLDRPVNQPALLLVVAIQLAPQPAEGSAEAVAGLLMGHYPPAENLTPLAVLHRPEQAQGPDDRDLRYALQQSLDWVPLRPASVTSGWLVGVDRIWHQAIASALKALACPLNIGQDVHDLGTTLGYPGPAAPWLAIACAVQRCRNGEPQLMVSGDNQAASPLWVTVVAPYTPA